MPERRRSRLVLGLLAALVAALGAYDTVVLGGVTASGGWTPVALYSATALLFLVPYASPRARSFCQRVVRTRPVRAGLALVGMGSFALAVWLAADFARAPPGEFGAALAVGFWVLVLGGTGVSVLRSVYHGPGHDHS
ncbi:hypothetical protein [Halosimplex pelagicum]|uniref:DUF3054 domain-containing protein n=1 Tax=Halosimplex pelagicum TaxID=869886 RepID=A0A7D5P832_9EURY|nr:hypothetical protein [Halosimplex pelagicum]QLH80105.1 hypothetical protein HZS54_00020 [Halosimplex pelagicum]